MISPVSSECFISFQVKCWLNDHDCDDIVETKKLVNQKRISDNEIQKTYEKYYIEEFKYPLGDGNRNNYTIIPKKKEVQSNLMIRNFLVTLILFLNAKCSLSLQSKLTIGSLTPICSSSKLSLSPSLTVYVFTFIRSSLMLKRYI